MGRRWSIPRAEVTYAGDHVDILDIRFADDGSALVIEHWDHAVRIWDLPNADERDDSTRHG